MASTNKTANLGLNSWLGTDKPTRTDFVEDNAIIDSAISSHTGNSTAHLTSEEKSRVSSPVLVRQYAGTGSASLTISFAFSPKLVIVQRVDYPTVSGDAACFGVVTPTYGGTLGLELSASSLTVKSSSLSQGQSGFNENGGQYIAVAFR